MTPFERMLESTLYVAADRARRESRPMAVERCPAAWTVRDATEPTPSGYERITQVQPDDYTDEARMGIAKRIYTARSEGKPVAVAVLAFFGQEPASKMPLLTGDTLPAAIVSKQVADSFAPPIEPTPPPAPEATMSTPATKVEKIDGRNWAREIQDQLLSLPSVQRFIEEHGDLAQLGQGLPCARDAKQFIYPNLFERFQKLIEEKTEERYIPSPDPEPSPVELTVPPVPTEPVATAEANAPWLAEPGSTDIIPPWVEIASEANAPTKRELALRRSCDTARPPRTFDLTPEQQRGLVPTRVYMSLARSLENIKHYRDSLERTRELGRKFGGGRRYVDDVRINLKPELRRSLPDVREFVRKALELEVDPYPILRAIWAGETFTQALLVHPPEVAVTPSDDPMPMGERAPEAAEHFEIAADLRQPDADHSVDLVGVAHPTPSEPAAVEPVVPIAPEVPDPVPQPGPNVTSSPRRGGRRKQAAAGQGSLFD